MKYKVLLVGTNKAIIDDFFNYIDERFMCMSTSIRHEDIVNHVKYYEPDIFIYCMHEERKENISSLAFAKSNFNKVIPFVIIGNQGDVDQFYKNTVYTADLILLKPISINQIEEKLLKFMSEWEGNYSEEEEEEKQSPYEEMIQTMEEKKREEDVMAEKLLAEQILSGVYTYEESEMTRKHVLVVDDDAVMLKVIKRQLSDKYNVATAVSGKIALKFLETKKTDMVLLDYEMPGESGAEVLEEIRKRSETQNLPVVFLTGISDREKIQQVLSLKPQGYLLKPVDRDQLLQKIKEVIG